MDNPRFVLAPLAGYTDKAFREICVSYGAEATVSEMVSAEGLSRDSIKTIDLMDKSDKEKNYIVQLFGSSPDPFLRAIDVLKANKIEKIDINCGCPVPKVVKTGSGSALMKEPKKIREIVKVLKDNLNIPISVKFRLGWDNDSINYLEFAEEAVLGGASALTLHARTRSQGYEGKADRNAFKNLSDYFKGENILLYASGDIFSPEDALDIITNYGMDGVMFARGAIGNPFIFKETKDYIENGEYTLPSLEERIECALNHYDIFVKYYGEDVASRAMRKHALAYCKGLKGAAKCKNLISLAKEKKDYIDAFSTLYN